jgi:hypothetical protein
MRAVVGVTPPEGLRRRGELFGALAHVFDVDFEPREASAWNGLSALVILDGADPGALPSELPVLVFQESESPVEPSATSMSIELAASRLLDTRLRGRKLGETGLSALSRRLADGDEIAGDEQGLVWTSTSAHVETALIAPADLEPGEPLRNRLRAGRFLALLPLVQLLRRTTGYERVNRPQPRAAFLFDDPNLHWPSYGHIHFGRLDEDARRHGYHVAFATIPLDTWFGHPRVVRTFRRAPTTLSLALHGNDHTYQELAQPRRPDEAVALFDQAIRRVRAFEKRTGLEVSRVMIPPHGLCADAMLGPMLAAEIEAVCRAPGWWGEWEGAHMRAARWRMADVSPAAAPIIGRHLLTREDWRDEVTFDLYLDQPAVLYGHHHDLAAGYDVLREAARWLNGVEGMTWQSLGDLARGNLVTERRGDTLRVEAFTRHAVVDVPADVRTLELRFPGNDATAVDVLLWNERAAELRSETGTLVARIDMPEGGSSGALRLERVRPPRVAVRSGVRPRPLARRGASELRDRLHPLVRKAGLERALRMLEDTYGRRARARVGRGSRTSA